MLNGRSILMAEYMHLYSHMEYLYIVIVKFNDFF